MRTNNCQECGRYLGKFNKIDGIYCCICSSCFEKRAEKYEWEWKTFPQDRSKIGLATKTIKGYNK